MVIRETYYFIKHLRKPEPTPYIVNRKKLIYTGLALAFLLMCIFKGIGV